MGKRRFGAMVVLLVVGWSLVLMGGTFLFIGGKVQGFLASVLLGIVLLALVEILFLIKEHVPNTIAGVVILVGLILEVVGLAGLVLNGQLALAFALAGVIMVLLGSAHASELRQEKAIKEALKAKKS